jgi:hypothetical protein
MQNKCPYTQSAFLDILCLLLRQLLPICREQSLQAQIARLRRLLFNKISIPNSSMATVSFSLDLASSYTLLISTPWKEEYAIHLLEILDRLLVHDPSSFSLLCDEYTTIVPNISTQGLNVLVEALFECIDRTGKPIPCTIKAAETVTTIFELNREGITKNSWWPLWSKVQDNWTNAPPSSPSYFEAHIRLWALLIPKLPGVCAFSTALHKPLAQEYWRFMSFIRPHLHDHSVRYNFYDKRQGS